ncbi:MAG TPA: hypothetical protein PLU45_03600 [Bacteroidales bacterium]|nr:hypothetical protein [Bacteroidales bacterium]
MEIRTLRADEIECRVQQVKKTGCVLLIYKDARVDMRILDEVYGAENWQRTHEVINGNLFCNVEIWCSEKKQWVKKQDVGTESNTEKQKGEASDSFKRACFNVGIGRELYTAPFTWINLVENEVVEKSGKYYLNFGISFSVKEIEYDENRNISKLTIIDNKKVERFKFNKNALQDMKKQKEVPTQNNSNDKEIELAKQTLEMCTSVDTLGKMYTALEPHLKIALKQFTTELKTKLETKQNGV